MNAHQDPVHCTPFLDLPFLERDVATEERADGSLLMRSRVPLGTVEAHLPAVLQRHGAALEIESVLGKGSTFRVRFPAGRLRRSAAGTQLSAGAARL